MPRGGKRANPGPERKLTREQSDEIAREYERRMQVWAEAAAVAKARRTDPVRKKRQEISLRMAAKAARFGDGSLEQLDTQESPAARLKLPAYEAAPLVAELEAAGEPAPFPEPKAPYGARNRVARDVAEAYKIKPQTVIECFNQRSWRKQS